MILLRAKGIALVRAEDPSSLFHESSPAILLGEPDKWFCFLFARYQVYVCSLASWVRECGWGEVGEGGWTHVRHGRSLMYDHRPSHAYNVGAEQVGLSTTRQTWLA